MHPPSDTSSVISLGERRSLINGSLDRNDGQSDSSALVRSAAGHRSQQSTSHRKNAPSDSIPRQTLLKALASVGLDVGKKRKPEALSLDGMLSAQAAPNGADPSSDSSQLQDALAGLGNSNRSLTPATAFPALQSPCFYHNRFDDAVDINKVLEEIKNDEYMSHHRLVQTATGVREVSKQLQRRPIKRAVKNVMIVTKANY